MDWRLIVFLCLAGCVGSVDAPSLAPRAEEGTGVPAPDAAVEPAATIDPNLAPRLGAIFLAAQEGHRRFEEARRLAEAAARRPGAQRAGSDAWTGAQQALSVLESARDGVRIAGADLDVLRSDPAYAAAANRGAIDETATRIIALDSEEARTIASIAGELS